MRKLLINSNKRLRINAINFGIAHSSAKLERKPTFFNRLRNRCEEFLVWRIDGLWRLHAAFTRMFVPDFDMYSW